MKNLQEMIRAFRVLSYGIVRTHNKSPIVNNWQFLASDTSLWAGNLQTATEAGFVVSKDIVVIDVDPRNFKEGINSLQELSKAIDFDLEANAKFSTRTASGGLHLYYKKNPTIKFPNQLANFKGVEFKQKGQQVIIPFSVLPDNRKYELINANLENLTALPQSFYDIIGTKNDNQVIKSGVGFINHEYDIERVRQILVNTEPAIEGQGGDNHTYKVCCIGKENGLSPDVFFDLLCEWNNKCSPPWNVKELYQKMLNAYNYSQNAAGSHSIENMFSFLTDNKDSQPIKNKIPVITLDDFLAMDIKPTEFILFPIIPTQGLVMLFAQTGIGKTHVSLDIAYAVACGGIAIGKWQASKPRKVLFIDGEMPANVLQERLTKIKVYHEKELPDKSYLKIMPTTMLLDMSMDLSNIQHQKMIEEYVNDVELVILDNISTLCGGVKENEAESWKPMQEWILFLRKKDISVLLIHHTSKNEDNQRGTTKKEDILDTTIKLKRPKDYEQSQGARFEVHYGKTRGFYGNDAKPFEAWLKTTAKIVDNDMRESIIWEVKDLENTKLEQVLELQANGLKLTDIAKELNVSKGYVSKLMKKGREEGKIKSSDEKVSS